MVSHGNSVLQDGVTVSGGLVVEDSGITVENGGMQLHYQRLGNRPEILRYTVEAPAAGKYAMTLKVCTVSQKYQVIARLNRRTVVNTMLPYTKGIWQSTEPEIVELRQGRNTIQLTFRAPNRGVSIKEFQLKPVAK